MKSRTSSLTRARGSFLALALGVAAWASGCATAPRPMVDPGFAAGAYGPARVAVMPPDVFVVVDQVGDNDPAQSAALGQAVSYETARAIDQALRARGYDADFSARWDGIAAPDGTPLMGRDELGWLANGILQFANGPAGGTQGAPSGPVVVAPELAARVGAATQADALLYVNVKGAVTTPGKRTASVVGAVFIVVIVAAIVLAVIASSKSGGSGGSRTAGTPGGGGFHGAPVARAPTSSGFRGAPVGGGGGGGFRGVPVGGGGGGGSAFRGAPVVGGGSSFGGGARTSSGWRAGSHPGPIPAGTRVYGGGPHVHVGVAVIVPLDGPQYTHDGSVGYDDPWFAGDELYVSMTLVSTYDGRVLWHAREHLDLEADHPEDIDRMVQTFLATLPPRPGMPPAPAKP